MRSTLLRDFVAQAREANRIRFGDVRRLRRDILPARIATREEAELLIDLDRSVSTVDRGWSDYLVMTVRDFTIWGTPPIGVVDRDKAEWIIAALSNGGVTKNGRAIARGVAAAAPHVADALKAFARQPKATMARRNDMTMTAANSPRLLISLARP